MTHTSKVEKINDLLSQIQEINNQGGESAVKLSAEEYLYSKSRGYNWLYNFIGGGFNDSWGFTRAEAIQNAYDGADQESFRKATRQSSDAQNRAGWMMSM